MTKAEETRLHNLFIKFKNEGKSLDDIGKLLLNIPEGTLADWEKKLTKNQTTLSLSPTFHAKKTVIDAKGKYIMDTSELDLAVYNLKKILTIPENNIYQKEILNNTKKYLPIFQNYFTKLSLEQGPHQQLSVEYELNTEEETIVNLAQEAVQFYINFKATLENQFKFNQLIKTTSDNIYRNKNQILDYAIKRLEVKNFEGVKKSSFQSVPIDSNWIFLIGENGYGKTTILRSIAIGFIGEYEDSIPFVSTLDNEINIEYYSKSVSIIHNTNYTFNSFPHLACYGPSRLQIQTDQTQNDVAKKSTTTYSLFNSDGILLNIEFELLIWFLEKSPKFENVKQTFLNLIPYLSDIQVDVPNRKIYYIEKEPAEEGDSYTPVQFEQLASGFRSIIAMVGDMVIRLFKSQPDITNPSELAGIVIIDELDLHWHPKMQREIPQLLSKIFPKIQFIASTHSLVPLLGAPENSVLLKVNRTKEEGITVEKIEIDFQALSSDTMLRDIFDLEKYMSDAKQQAWERYTKLKSLIHFEKDETKKLAYIEEREKLGDKYKFGL